MEATDSRFALTKAHDHQSGKAIGLVNGETPPPPPSQKPLTAEVGAKQSIKRQLYTTHVGTFGWEPQSSSTTTWAGKVDHELKY